VNTILGVRGAHTFVDLEKHYVHGVFRALNDHGAGRHRWRSLSICSNELSTLFVILDFLCRHPVPDLTALALKWKRGASLPKAFKQSLNFDLPNRLHHAFELWKKIERELFLPNVITLSNLLTPKLGCLRLDMGAPSSPKLWPLFKNLTSLSLIPLYILTTLDISSFHCQQDGIPCLLSNMPGVHNLSICGCYAKVLNRLWPLFKNLTSLSLTTFAQFPHLDRVADVLSQNQSLEVLHLDTGPLEDCAGFNIFGPIRRVRLLSLHTFTFRSNYQHFVLMVLATIVAPSVHNFTLASRCFDDELLHTRGHPCIAETISAFYKPPEEQYNIPLYILTTLDISSFHCHQDGIACLLSNMPGVHNLSICGCYAKVLNRLWVLPRLSELTISVCELTPESAHRHLRRALRSRAKVGYPDILVQLPADWKARIESKYQNPGRVLLMEYLSPAVAEPPYPESEDEEVDD
ncbi:hypothetical protein RSAG8_00671, partial [Rhizoctonia solani AG-8 WAC10335]